MKLKMLAVFSILVMIFLSIITCCSSGRFADSERDYTSDHFDGEKFFNKEKEIHHESAQTEKKRSSWRMFGYWTSGWIFGFSDWPVWPYFTEDSLSIKNQRNKPKPLKFAYEGEIRITPVGHSTFLIQLGKINILTDPQWSDRASPVSFKGPKRHHLPGIDLIDLPPIDVVLISHNHYDHLDIPTLEDLSKKGIKSAITPLGNAELISDAGFDSVQECDWWEKIRISDDVEITVVPAQHFSSRTLWDRNEALWCGFIISYKGEYIYYSGDTGYSKYFKEIKEKYTPIKASILPISPYRDKADTIRVGGIHMNIYEVVTAHLDLNSELSIACHSNVFQLGPLKYNEAETDLKNNLIKRNIPENKFIAPELGIPIIIKSPSE